ncbi:MAG: hypothetical protein IJS17_05620 [Clostridia bacterium]|nr:hypothetical protein [Clostridia bacterium]
MDKNNEKTHLYSQGDSMLDDALKTYEITVEQKSKKRSFSFKKFSVVIGIFIVAAALCAAAFMIFAKKNYSGVLIKTADGKYALAGKEIVEINQSVERIKTSYENTTVAFLDKQKNLYALDTLKYSKPGDEKLVCVDFDGEFVILKNDCVVYLSNKTLYCYDFKNSTAISDNVEEIFTCEKSEKIIYLTSDKRLFSFDSQTAQSLASNVKKTEFRSNKTRMNLIFLADGGLYLADENAQVTLMSASSTQWVSSKENEVWDNIYFYEKSSQKRQLNIEFSDELAQSDSEMKEPVSSDYKKSLVFGLIQFVDPAQYKSAYIEYQKKLSRDSVREYAKNFEKSVDCTDIFCFGVSGISSLKSSVLPDEVLFFSKSGDPQVMLNDLSKQNVTLEISELVSEMKNVKSQEDFDRLVLQKLKEENSSSIKISGVNFEVDAEVENISEISGADFSKNGEAILLEKSGIYYLEKIKEISLETIFENLKIKDLFFEESKLIFTDENSELFCVDFLKNFEKISLSKNVSQIQKIDGNFYLLKEDLDSSSEYKIFKDGQILSLAKNCTDFLFVDENNYFYVSQGNIYCTYGDKLFVQNGIAEIMK